MSVFYAAPALRLVSSPSPSATALQATLAAAVQALDRAVGRVRAAEQAALSLAQRERLEGVAVDLEGTAADLRPRLDSQGRCLMEGRMGWAARLRAHFQAAAADAPGAPWALALADAVTALDEASSRMACLAAGATTEAAAVARTVACRLCDHRDALLREADRWAAHAA
ncbi:MAG TPA: hypothetical protein VK610_07150 [Rhodothermales bacterium]|nr:hypothetical protein [Rhodothermales bacterium]